MNDKNTTAIAASLLLLLMAGCSQHRHHHLPHEDAGLPPDGDRPEAVIETARDPAAPEAPARERHHSVLEAREQAIHHLDERIAPPFFDETEPAELSALLYAPSPITDAETEFTLSAKLDGTPDDIPASAEHSPSDLWQRLRAGFALPDADHPQVESHTRWYARHQSYLDRTFTRARPYLHYIVEEVEKRGMPMEIALLPVVESAFQPFAYSHGRASGIWQFIPGTARNYGLRIDWWYDGRRDIKASTRAALDYLERLHKMFDGDWLLALAAYNSGEGTVRRAIRRNEKRGKDTTFWDLKLPRETRGYVPKLLAISNVVADPAGHGVTLVEMPNEPYLAEVEVGTQIDLALAAELAGLTLEELYLLNPGFNRWATPPDGPHTLLLPLDKVERFERELAAVTPERRIKWVRHRIRPGETLGQIARDHGTTVAVLQRVNDIRGHLIRAGHHLLIPVASRSAETYALSEEQRLRATQERPRNDGTRIDYLVRPGDTLWEISRAHGVSVRQLASWNDMAPGDTLKPGRRLVIWSPRRQLAERPPLERKGPRAATRKISYRVRQGDSLARISQRFNVSVNELKRWNPHAARSKYIQPGQMLVVYVDVTQVSENI